MGSGWFSWQALAVETKMEPMGLLVLGVVGYLFLRRFMPSTAFYAVATAHCKVLVIVLLLASLIGGITSHIQFADDIVFPLILLVLLAVSRCPRQSRHDGPPPFPFLASLTSRAPPAF